MRAVVFLIVIVLTGVMVGTKQIGHDVAWLVGMIALMWLLNDTE